jgi:hypothetical protein
MVLSGSIETGHAMLAAALPAFVERVTSVTQFLKSEILP